MSDPKLLFVIGNRKTGSTWLQTLLNHHPNVLLFGEGIFHQFGMSLRRAMNEYNQGLENKTKIFGERAFAPLRKEEFVSIFRGFVFERLRHEAADTKSNKKIVWLGEKDPDHARFANIMFDAFPDASYIHIIRDGRDVAVSWWFHMVRFDPERTAHQFNNGLADTIVPSAKDWTSVIQMARREQKRTGVRYHELKYEDLVDDPEKEVKTVLEFLNLPPDPVLIKECVEKASFGKMSGGRKQGQEDKSSFFRKGIKGDWQNHMNNKQSTQFIDATGGLMQELGYT